MTISLVSDITLKSSHVWLTNTIQNTIHSLVNSHISMSGGQFSHFRDKRSLDRPGHGTPWVNSGTIPAIPGRLASLNGISGITGEPGIHICFRWPSKNLPFNTLDL